MSPQEPRKAAERWFSREPGVANDTEMLYIALLITLDAGLSVEEQKAWPSGPEFLRTFEPLASQLAACADNAFHSTVKCLWYGSPSPLPHEQLPLQASRRPPEARIRQYYLPAGQMTSAVDLGSLQ